MEDSKMKFQKSNVFKVLLFCSILSSFGLMTASIAYAETYTSVANFSSNVSSGNAPLSVQFTDLSENATGWIWDFGDGANSIEQNPTHTYFVEGSYTVNLTINDGNSSNSTTGIITVLEKLALIFPVANFSTNVSEGYAPLSVQFTDLSENATEWKWDFDDNGAIDSTDRNPRYDYAAPGTYTANLTVSNENGTNFKLVIITVLEKPAPIFPVANFTTNVSEGYAPLTVQFTDLSENATGWAWDFGDGIKDSENRSPIHEYAVPGVYAANLTVNNANGTNSTSINITVFEKVAPIFPVANFSTDVSSGYAPLTVQFTDRSENATVWNWAFGDGASSTEKTPLHTYSAAGNYTANLTVSNENGTASRVATITVLKEPEVLPVADFRSNVTTGYVPLAVQFTDLSKYATEWEWDFGDGTSSTEQNPMHTYSAAGNYTVTLTVNNEAGTDTETKAGYIIINPVSPKLVAAFIASPISGDAPLKVVFTDRSTGLPISWRWDFGDGANSTKKNPKHTYFAEGNYTVNLTISDGNSSNSTTGIITVLTVIPAYPPVANFSSNVTSGNAPLAVQFNDRSENATAVSWDFEDDGSIDSPDRNPVHIYATPGTYTVNLTAINANGAGSKFANIIVQAVEQIYPVASFTSNVTNGTAPLSVQFTDLSENATGWNWDFGDGVNSTEQNPKHTYFTAGNYTVSLTASNENGTNSMLASINVSESPVLPVANFSTSVTSGYVPLSVKFKDRSENANEWRWDFGDGTNSTKQNPTHTYSVAGNYIVSLTVGNGNGTDSKLAPINVSALPVTHVADFTSENVPFAVKFTDHSENAIRWRWSFGDGTESTEQNPTHAYPTAGNYTVNLTVNNGKYKDSLTGIINVQAVIPIHPVANFSSNVSSGFAPLSVQFNDSSENAIVWIWDFGDGNSSPEQNPIHTYSAAGNYTVSLTVSNENGTDVKSSYINILNNSNVLVAAFTSSSTSGSAPLNVSFTDQSTGLPISWIWNFGDGNTSTEQNPVHVYNNPGLYTVSLTASNAGGNNTLTKSSYIAVSNSITAPVATFSANTTSGSAPLSVSFTDSSAGLPTSWVWTFGDGNTSTEQNPAHVYSNAGLYTVSLTANNPGGSSTETKYEYIKIN